jgi:hypothetical protein
MTAYTANVAIPYPTSSDSLCSLSSVLGDAAAVVESAMVAVESVISAVATKETWRVSVATQTVIPNDTEVPFVSVDFDTTGSIDLSSDPYTVKLRTGGVWCAGSWWSVLGVSAGQLVRGNIAGFSLASAVDYLSAVGWAGTSMSCVANQNSGDEINLTILHYSSPATISAMATMWAFRLGSDV